MTSNIIPIRNIYFLLSYAWRFVGKGEEDFLNSDTFKGSSELFAGIFNVCLAMLARRGHIKDYVERSEGVAGVKGKFRISESVSTGAIFSGYTNCDFDEYSFDCNFNQIIKASITTLVKDVSVSDKSFLALKRHLRLLSNVKEVELTADHFKRLTFHSHNRHYRFILEICRLLFESISISNNNNEVVFQNFLEKEVQMSRVFESFVREFYDLNKAEVGAGLIVKRDRFHWDLEMEDSLFAERVPELETDVSIHGREFSLIIETKYYSEALAKNYGHKIYRRDHLSQIMEYMRVAKREKNRPVRGILLYPTVDQPINDRGTIEGFDVTVATIDLSQSWDKIHKDLIRLAQKVLA